MIIYGKSVEHGLSGVPWTWELLLSGTEDLIRGVEKRILGKSQFVFYKSVENLIVNKPLEMCKCDVHVSCRNTTSWDLSAALGCEWTDGIWGSANTVVQSIITVLLNRANVLLFPTCCATRPGLFFRAFPPTVPKSQLNFLPCQIKVNLRKPLCVQSECVCSRLGSFYCAYLAERGLVVAAKGGQKNVYIKIL